MARDPFLVLTGSGDPGLLLLFCPENENKPGTSRLRCGLPRYQSATEERRWTVWRSTASPTANKWIRKYRVDSLFRLRMSKWAIWRQRYKSGRRRRALLAFLHSITTLTLLPGPRNGERVGAGQPAELQKRVHGKTDAKEKICYHANATQKCISVAPVGVLRFRAFMIRESSDRNLVLWLWLELSFESPMPPAWCGVPIRRNSHWSGPGRRCQIRRLARVRVFSQVSLLQRPAVDLARPLPSEGTVWRVFCYVALDFEMQSCGFWYGRWREAQYWLNEWMDNWRVELCKMSRVSIVEWSKVE